MSSTLIRQIINDGLAEMKKQLMDTIETKVGLMSTEIQNHGTSIQQLTAVCHELKSKIQVSQVTETSTEDIPLPSRGGSRVCPYHEQHERGIRPAYHPYVPVPTDVPALKRNSKNPHVTLGYEFDSIQICNQWIKAQVCVRSFVRVLISTNIHQLFMLLRSGTP